MLHELDFSAIPAAGNNANFTLRFTPSGTGSEKENIEGNQRLDHISVEARPLAGGK
ncbi:hypothetical protein D3C83_283110 [compost metagenome]